MTVRVATLEDLKQVSKVHVQCFPNSFSTQLGTKLLMRFYYEYMKVNPELFLVAEEDEIVGFCMGYYCGNNQFTKNFVKNNWFRIGLQFIRLAITGNPLFYEKLGKIFKKSQGFAVVDEEVEAILPDQKGDLLSVCVLDAYRGAGVAQELIEAYEDQLLQAGRQICLLTVDPKNTRAVRFYERNGYRVLKKAPTATGYAKRLK